jgi:hypothetical protein
LHLDGLVRWPSCKQQHRRRRRAVAACMAWQPQSVHNPSATPAEESAAFFVDVFVTDVRQRVREVRELRRQTAADVRAADRGEDWAPTDEDFYQSFGRRWAAQHHLVIAAHQLQLWVERLVKERALRGRHDQMPDRDAVVENLRNALEHLNEADLDEGLFATAGEAPVKGRVGKTARFVRLEATC